MLFFTVVEFHCSFSFGVACWDALHNKGHSASIAILGAERLGDVRKP
jgi:hypothetical protein